MDSPSGMETMPSATEPGVGVAEVQAEAAMSNAVKNESQPGRKRFSYLYSPLSLCCIAFQSFSGVTGHAFSMMPVAS